MIKNIITDLGNCWLTFDFNRLIASLAAKSRLNTKEIISTIEWSEDWNNYSKGKIDAKEFYRVMIRQKIHFFDSFDAFEYFWCNGVFALNLDYICMLSRLEKAGYKIYCLSNIDELHWKHITGNFSEILPIFRKCFLSFEMGKIKPDVEIYNEVIAEIGGKPDEFLFIDDLVENVEAAANKAGMKILLYDYKKHHKSIKRLDKILSPFGR